MLLERSDLQAGSAPTAIARALGYPVKYRHTLGGKVIGRYCHERCVIFVAPGLAHTRREFTVAHELMHAYAPQHLVGDELERWCDRGAAALMMPAREFLVSGTSCGWDLAVLREWWPHCSWNALVRRITDLVPGTAASAWHEARRGFRRQHPEVELPEHADELEEFVAAEAVETGASELQLAGVEVKAWRTGPRRAVAVVRKVAG